jgi:nicotinamidase-related amidase
LKNFYLDKNDCALLVVDIQEKLFNTMNETVRLSLIKNSSILIETCSAFSIPVVVTEQYRKGLGPTISAIHDKTGYAPIFEKTTFDCMKNGDILHAVKSLHKKTFILCGIESHICVFQTALSLINLLFKVVIAADAVMSRRKADWSFALKALMDAGALIYPTETISFMLIEDAAAPEFRNLAPLFK